MKLQNLRNAAVKAQQALEQAERKAAGLLGVSKVVKAKLEQAKLEYKRLRKTAKQTRRVAAEAVEQVSEQAGVLEKAQKKLAKAMAKTRRKAGKKAKPARPARAAVRRGRKKAVRSKPGPQKRSARVPETPPSAPIPAADAMASADGGSQPPP